jgi:hypothetical protein
VLEPEKRSHLWTWSVSVALIAAGSFALLAAAKGAQRENRIVERIRPACAHTRFTNEEMHRLVRTASGSWSTEEDAVRAVVAICGGTG